MNSHMLGGGTFPLRAFALALGVWVLFDSSVMADDNGVVITDQVAQGPKGEEGPPGPG